MTPAAYLESIGYTIEPVRGMLEVWRGNDLILDQLTKTELAAFADEVRTQREQNPWPNR